MPVPTVDLLDPLQRGFPGNADWRDTATRLGITERQIVAVMAEEDPKQEEGEEKEEKPFYIQISNTARSIGKYNNNSSRIYTYNSR